MKAQFSFDPSSDDDIPCKEAGLAFQKGEILEILDQTDATWWQVPLTIQTLCPHDTFYKSSMRPFW